MFGAISIAMATVNTIRGRRFRASAAARNVALSIAIVCLVSGGWMFFNTVRSQFHVMVPALCGVQIVFAGAAIVAWRSRWRGLTEGAATISLGIFAILTGFSIGIFFLPVALAMGVAAIAHAMPRDAPGAELAGDGAG